MSKKPKRLEVDEESVTVTHKRKSDFASERCPRAPDPQLSLAHSSSVSTPPTLLPLEPLLVPSALPYGVSPVVRFGFDHALMTGREAPVLDEQLSDPARPAYNTVSAPPVSRLCRDLQPDAPILFESNLVQDVNRPQVDPFTAHEPGRPPWFRPYVDVRAGSSCS
ncbi:uncharacterized protein B0H18DRAFT_1119621 [Fomitopsis serialis]|uniref:uncharacterized protein n=1 Tax=Fomitopsis serialis TaxID=139415 RepID=UPI0020072BB9|nr:uncharacterized protein B0H18DRAFT_1119621 [Neoantrodia serialis]KAH9925196.1 hypothetical protein B0H18DRAFT_1119621 [Neoantrodia serialis]